MIYVVVRNDIINRLNHFGITVNETDNDQIDFELQKIINYTLNYCHIDAIPEIIEPRLIDRVCADYLNYKKNTGTLDDFNYDTVIKQIKEGDTTIQFANGQGEDTPENRFDSFVKSLERGYDKWITGFRRLQW